MNYRWEKISFYVTIPHLNDKTKGNIVPRILLTFRNGHDFVTVVLIKQSKLLDILAQALAPNWRVFNEPQANPASSNPNLSKLLQNVTISAPYPKYWQWARGLGAATCLNAIVRDSLSPNSAVGMGWFAGASIVWAGNSKGQWDLLILSIVRWLKVSSF